MISLYHALFISFHKFQIAMTDVPLCAFCSCQETFQKDASIGFTVNLKWLKVVRLLQLEKLGSSSLRKAKESLCNLRKSDVFLLEA